MEIVLKFRLCVFRSGHRLVMSDWRMLNCPASASKGFSSTPVKISDGKDFLASRGLADGVLSDDEDTFSLLSPIYHDSFDSEEDLDSSPAHQTSGRQSDNSRRSISPERYCSEIKMLSNILCFGSYRQILNIKYNSDIISPLQIK